MAQDDAPLCSTDVAYPDGVFPEHRGHIVPIVEIGGPAYAIDDQTAIRVSDGSVDVISEGLWKRFTPSK